jgi:hypothetical protein
MAYGGVLAGVLVTAAASFVIFAHPPAQVGDTQGTGLRSKGETAASPLLDVACLRASLSACPHQSMLAFSVANGDPAMFLTAYADPVSSPSPGTTTERIWYLTNEPLAASAPGTAGATRVLSKAGVIGDEHRVGSYRVHLLLTRHPIARAEVARGVFTGDNLVARSVHDLVVTP